VGMISGSVDEGRGAWFRWCLCFLVVAGLFGCGSSPKIYSTTEKGVDFESYKTFSFLESLEPKGQGYTSIEEKYLRAAIAKQLEARGLKEVQAGELLVGFKVSAKEKLQSRAAPQLSTGYYTYRGRHGYSYGMSFGADTQITQYTEGTLNVDVVDAAQKQLIWEGVAIGRLKDQPAEDIEAEVKSVVSAIFAKYPVMSKAQEVSD
jgi:Domain of unknown function (DUF4136)